MAYVGLIPSEHSSGGSQRRGHITKAGNRLLRHVLIESAHHARRTPQVSPLMRRRLADLPEPLVALSWRAQQRLHFVTASWAHAWADLERWSPWPANWSASSGRSAPCGRTASSVRCTTGAGSQRGGSDAEHPRKCVAARLASPQTRRQLGLGSPDMRHQHADREEQTDDHRCICLRRVPPPSLTTQHTPRKLITSTSPTGSRLTNPSRAHTCTY